MMHELGLYQLTLPQCIVVQFVSGGSAKVLATCSHDGNIELDRIIAAISIEGRSSATIQPPSSSTATSKTAETDADSSVTDENLRTIEKSALAADTSTRYGPDRGLRRTVRSAPSPVLFTYLTKPSLDPFNTTNHNTTRTPEIEPPAHSHGLSQEALIALCVITALLGIIDFIMFVIIALVRLAIE
jgi:hypothetical protein